MLLFYNLLNIFTNPPRARNKNMQSTLMPFARSFNQRCVEKVVIFRNVASKEVTQPPQRNLNVPANVLIRLYFKG